MFWGRAWGRGVVGGGQGRSGVVEGRDSGLASFFWPLGVCFGVAVGCGGCAGRIGRMENEHKNGGQASFFGARQGAWAWQGRSRMRDGTQTVHHRLEARWYIEAVKLEKVWDRDSATCQF